MKNLKLWNPILLLVVCSMTLSCVTIQQPLPGSLWGNWTLIKTGTITHGSNQQLYDYRNACYKKSDELHFSSDKKMTLRWYDNRCSFNFQKIGRYHVEGNTLKVNLENDYQYQNSPFPPITEYLIVHINDTTLKLEEIRNDNDAHRNHTNSSDEVLVFVFLRLDR